MKKSILLAIIVLVQNQTYADEKNFQPWCDTFTAEGMVSLVANRIYGNTSGLSDKDYEARSKWISDTYKQAEKHFGKITGLNFQDFSYPKEWIAKCQLKDQIH